MTTPTDTALIAEVRQGKIASFEMLIERHFGVVYAIALARLRDPEMAEDLAQEVFVRAHLHLARLDDPERFGPWVSRVAKNLAIDWLRRGQRRSQILPQIALDEMRGDVPDPTSKGAREMMASDEESVALRSAVMDLPADLREAVLLHFAEDLTQAEIAERLHLSQPTVSRRLREALGKLHSALEPTLRAEITPLRAPKRAFARAGLIAVATAAMSTSAKAALATSAPMQTSTGGSGAITGMAGLFSFLSTLTTTGGNIMVTGKGLLAAGAAILAVGGGVYLARQGEPEGATSSIVSINTEGGEIADMLALVPEDADMVMVLADYDAAADAWDALGGAVSLHGDPNLFFSRVNIDDLDFAGRSAVLFVDSPMEAMMFPLRSGGEAAFMSDERREETFAGGTYWTNGISQSLSGSTRIEAWLQKDNTAARLTLATEQDIEEFVSPHSPSRLIEYLTDIPSDATQLAINLRDTLNGPMETLDMMEQMRDNPPPNMAMSISGIVLFPFLDGIRQMALWGESMDQMVVTAMPSAQGLEARVVIGANPAPVTRELTLATHLPPGSMVAMSSGKGGRSGYLLMWNTLHRLGNLLYGYDNPTSDAMRRLPETLLTLEYYDYSDTVDGQPVPERVWTEQEIAYALYPSEDNPINPGRVLIYRPLDEEYDSLIQNLEMNWIDAETVSDTGLLNCEHVETITLQGHEIHHLRFTGSGLNVERDMNDLSDMRSAPLLAMFGSLGEVNHWFSHRDGMVILTTEPEPVLMEQFLRGENEITETPATEVAVRLSMLNLLTSTTRGTERLTADNPNVHPALTEEAIDQWRETEEGIWLIFNGGATGLEMNVTIPAGDVKTFFVVSEGVPAEQ